MIIDGKQKCEKYGKEFEWAYKVTEFSGHLSYDARSIGKDKTLIRDVVESIEKDGYLMPIKMTSHCPDLEYDKLNYINYIIVEEK